MRHSSACQESKIPMYTIDITLISEEKTDNQLLTIRNGENL